MVVALDLQLVEDELTHEVVFRLVNNFLRLGVLGDGALLDDQYPIREGQGLLRVVGDDDGGQVILPSDGS